MEHGARAAEMNEWRWENVLESQIYDLHYHRERGECVHSEQGLIVHLGGRSFEKDRGREMENGRAATMHAGRARTYVERGEGGDA